MYVHQIGRLGGQVVWVLEGELVIDEAGTRHEMKAGDCLGSIIYWKRIGAP
jgi:uncharacterized cupin superfamily protein